MEKEKEIESKEPSTSTRDTEVASSSSFDCLDLSEQTQKAITGTLLI
jgi:hypothetical protein